MSTVNPTDPQALAEACAGLSEHMILEPSRRDPAKAALLSDESAARRLEGLPFLLYLATIARQQAGAKPAA